MQEISKTARTLAVTALLFTTAIGMGDLALTPIIAAIYQAFPGSTNFVNYIVSGPMAVMLVMSLLTPSLVRKLGKKMVIVTGSAIFGVGAICSVMILNPVYFAVMRTLVGIGTGMVMVVSMSLIPDLYEDTQARAKISGFYTAAGSVAGMTLAFVSGRIAAAGTWTDPFKIFWIAIPLTIMLIIFIPNIKPRESEKDVKRISAKEPLGRRFWIMNINVFVMNVVFGATVLYFISSYIIDNGIGDASTAGLATSIKSIVGFLIGLAFGSIYKRSKLFTPAICSLITAPCLVIMVIWPSVLSALLIGTIAGTTYKVMTSFYMVYCFSVVPPNRIDDAIAINGAFGYIGGFLATYYATFLMSAMNTDSVTKTFIVSAVIIGILGVFQLFMGIKETRDSKSVEETSAATAV
ncbi:MAG: MFS transporter [Spirochaetales bacterium]|jgi:MFS family permease|nr:MFS transporter [Spirochaetales bacterium]